MSHFSCLEQCFSRYIKRGLSLASLGNLSNYFFQIYENVHDPSEVKELLGMSAHFQKTSSKHNL